MKENEKAGKKKGDGVAVYKVEMSTWMVTPPTRVSFPPSKSKPPPEHRESDFKKKSPFFCFIQINSG